MLLHLRALATKKTWHTFSSTSPNTFDVPLPTTNVRILCRGRALRSPPATSFRLLYLSLRKPKLLITFRTKIRRQQMCKCPHPLRRFRCLLPPLRPPIRTFPTTIRPNAMRTTKCLSPPGIFSLETIPTLFTNKNRSFPMPDGQRKCFYNSTVPTCNSQPSQERAIPLISHRIGEQSIVFSRSSRSRFVSLVV